MRLLDAILEANRRRLAGDRTAFVAAAEHANALPLAALTCIDVRLNHLLPDALGIVEEQFIWLRNAGNVITSPLSSTTRSIALACAVKGAKEIVIIGHSDCQVCKTSMLQLLDRLSALGVDRHKLPENLVEYFGLSGSERQNVLRAAEIVRASPLIGTKVPVHGLMLDVATGRVECIVNGYDAPATVPLPGKAGEMFATAEQSLNKLAQIGNLAAELKVPTGNIGHVISTAEDWLHKAERVAAAVVPPVPAADAPKAATAAPPTLLTTLQDRLRQRAAPSSNPSRPQR